MLNNLPTSSTRSSTRTIFARFDLSSHSHLSCHFILRVPLLIIMFSSSLRRGISGELFYYLCFQVKLNEYVKIGNKVFRLDPGALNASYQATSSDLTKCLVPEREILPVNSNLIVCKPRKLSFFLASSIY